MEGTNEQALEEIQSSLVSIMTEQNSRLTEVTHRQDAVISNLSDEVCELKNVIKHLQGGSMPRRGDSGLWATRSIKLDLPHFIGEDPQGWLYQAYEYFTFHGIREDAKL